MELIFLATLGRWQLYAGLFVQDEEQQWWPY